MTTELRDKLRRVCVDIAADVEADVTAFDGKPFTGLNVGTQFGNHAAAIHALCNMVNALVDEVYELDPQIK